MSNDVPIVASTRQTFEQRTTRSVTPKAVPTAALTGSAATLYTAPVKTRSTGTPGATAKLMGINFCNTDSSARTVTLYLIASGGTASAANTVMAAVSIAAGGNYSFPCPTDGIPLASGEFIQGLASVTAVVTHRISIEELL
jgi:hypothetical protein